MDIAEHIEGWKQAAAREGAESGRTHASWVLDGNHPTGHYARLAQLMDDGDPALDDYLPPAPDLYSGASDDWGPARLFESVTGLDAHAEATFNHEAYLTVLEAIGEAFEQSAAETFQQECERLVKAAIPACEACGEPTDSDPDFCTACLELMREMRAQQGRA